MSEAAIRLEGLTKRFGALTAVDDLSFDVAKGSIFGFLGPNGSGKSTCIRMLCGLLEPTSGTATVNDFDIISDPESVKTSIGYMSQNFSLYDDLTVWENITFFARVYGLSGDRLQRRADDVMGIVGITDQKDKIAQTLSGGWKQRLALATALVHEPPLLFLDEPTAGIDPVARRALWDLLFVLAGEGKTLFVTTHYMDEAERCAALGYIYQSRLIALGTPEQLKSLPDVNRPGERRVELRAGRATDALAAVRHLPFVIDATIFGEGVHLVVPSDMSDDDILQAVALPDARVEEIEPSLEDVFVTLTERLAGEA